MKAVVSASDDEVLGFTMIGADAGEVMASVQVAMIAHLTYAEGLGMLFAGIPPGTAQLLHG